MYKLLLCWRYLRTRWIALASIVSVMLGVATMIVVNAVMAGFAHEMQKRIHGILSDVVVESLSLNGFHDPERRMAEIKAAAGEHIECMTETVTIPSMLSFRYAGQWVTRPVTVVGIPEDKPLAAEYAQYLQHPENRKQPSFRLREGGFDVRDHQAGSDAPLREVLEHSGWPWRRWKAERDRSWPNADRRLDPENGFSGPNDGHAPSLLEQAAFPLGRPAEDAAPGALGSAYPAAPKDSVAAAETKVPAPAGFSAPAGTPQDGEAGKPAAAPRIIIGEEEPPIGTAKSNSVSGVFSTDLDIPFPCGVFDPELVAAENDRKAAELDSANFFTFMLPKGIDDVEAGEFVPDYSDDGSVPIVPRHLQQHTYSRPITVGLQGHMDDDGPQNIGNVGSAAMNDLPHWMLPKSIEMDDEFPPMYATQPGPVAPSSKGWHAAPPSNENGSPLPIGVAAHGNAKSNENPPVVTPDDPFRGRPGSAKEFDPATEQNTGLVIGYALCTFRGSDKKDHFLVLPGDDVKLTMPTAGTPPRAIDDTFTVVDLYESKMNEYDSSFVFVPLKKLQQMRGMIDPTTGIGNVTSIQIRLKDPKEGNLVRDKLREAFAPGVYGVFTWRDKQGPLLAAVQMETAILNVLLFMIIAVAGFGILAIFYMIVVEKTRDIGVLKSLGASAGGVMSIFVCYGLSLGSVGAGVGTAIGLLFVHYINEIADLLSYATGQEVFDPTIYYFYEIPAIIHPWTVAWIALGAMAIAVTASILPARRAAALHPVEALRYE